MPRLFALDQNFPQPRELAVVQQTSLTLVVAHDSGHDPLKATGLLLAHLPYICEHTTPDEPQVWHLKARNQPGLPPWGHFGRAAQHQHRDVDELWDEVRLSAEELRQDPLAD